MPASDLGIGIDVVPSAPAPADRIAYKIDVVDLGPQRATGAQFEATLPAAVTPLSVPGGCTISGQVVRCAVPRLAPGAERTYEITAQVAATASPRTVVATVRVSGARPDPVKVDNRDIAGASIRRTTHRPPPRPTFTG